MLYYTFHFKLSQILSNTIFYSKLNLITDLILKKYIVVISKIIIGKMKTVIILSTFFVLFQKNLIDSARDPLLTFFQCIYIKNSIFEDFNSIFLAAQTNNVDMVNAYIALGGNLNMQDNNGKTGLMFGKLKRFVFFNKVIWFSTNKASQSGGLGVCNALISNGSRVDLRDALGNTALIYGPKIFNFKTFKSNQFFN